MKLLCVCVSAYAVEILSPPVLGKLFNGALRHVMRKGGHSTGDNNARSMSKGETYSPFNEKFQ